MAALRLRFVTQARDEVEAAAQFAHDGRWGEVGSICHGLAGRAGMFGFGELGDAARLIEESVESGADAASLDPLLAGLLEEVARLPQAAA